MRKGCNIASFKTYYRLTKPGIIYGNIMTAGAGFLFASEGDIDFWLLSAVLAGTSLVIASACVFNNYTDRSIDKKMARTKKRALVQGTVPPNIALLYATTLGVIGMTLLAVFTNWLVVIIAIVGYVDYLILYGYFKRRSTYGTLVGSICGATAIIAGYCAVTGTFDGGALILFLIMVCWQMPHFFAIAMYRSKDYAAAGIPVLPVIHGNSRAKIEIMAYTVAFSIATLSLTIFGYAGYTFAIVMGALSLRWLWLGFQGFQAANDETWARKLFFFSLIMLLALSALLSTDNFLP